MSTALKKLCSSLRPLSLGGQRQAQIFTSETISKNKHVIPVIITAFGGMMWSVGMLLHSCRKLDVEFSRDGDQPKWESVDLRNPPNTKMLNPCGEYKPMPELQDLREEIGAKPKTKVHKEPCAGQ